MRYLIYGAGTIGTAYGWLLSQKHEVDIYLRNEDRKTEFLSTELYVKDLRKKDTTYIKQDLSLSCITEITKTYDAILVAVNRCQLKESLPHLASLKAQTNYYAFMQNNWNIKEELNSYFKEDDYIIAFPSTIGGGREPDKIEIIVFDEGTRLGGLSQGKISNLADSLNKVQVKTEIDSAIFDWLKVHYLQQSITAGAVHEAGSFTDFAEDYKAVRKMVLAFREGIKVCKAHGIPTNKIFPSKFFHLPLFLVSHIMQNMFLTDHTKEMVENHMKKGLEEWVYGYYEVLNDGLKMGLPMTVWSSYKPYVDSRS